MTVPSEAAKTVLVRGPRVWDFRFTRVEGGDIESAQEVLSCTIVNNDLADKSKRTCTVTLPAGTDFDYLAHALRCYARLQITPGVFEEFALGTFLLAIPETAVDHPSEPTSTSGFDFLAKFAEATTTDRYTPTFGTSFGAILNNVALQVLGSTTINVPGELYDTIPTTHLQWDPGTSWLRVANDCLASVNCRSLAVDAYGVPYSTVYTDPATSSPIWTYTRDADSVIIRGSQRIALDLLDQPNVWVGVVSDPDGGVILRSEIVNDNPSSPTSTVSRGRTITRMLTSEEVGQPTTQIALDQVVARYEARDRSQYQHVTFESGLMPFHDTGDVLDVDLGDGNLPGRFREVSWEFPMRAGARMKHDVRRVVEVV